EGDGGVDARDDAHARGASGVRPAGVRPRLRLHADRGAGGGLMDVFEAMRRRRMHRRFTDEPVSEEVLAKLLHAAALAPMGGNELVRRLIVVTDRNMVKTVRDVTPSFLANAVAIIAICTDLERAEASMGRQGRDILSLLDAGAAAENVALAAPALGLGVSFVRS